MAGQGPETMQIGEWVIDPDPGTVTRKGETATLRPREMDLLVYLAQHAGEVVRTEDILRDVWSGVEVTNDSLYFSISQLRKVLDENSDAGSLIETIPKRGYRLTAAVVSAAGADANEEASAPPPADDGREHRWLQVGAAVVVVALGVLWFSQDLEPPAAAGDAGSVPGVADASRSIAVMPFVDLTPEADYTYFSDGITEEILNRLTRVPGLQVAARTSSFAFKDSAAGVVEIGETLGVSSLLEGSVRKEGDRVRIAVQLIDANTGFQLWSESFDRRLTSVFEIQNEISRRIANSLQIALLPDSDLGGGKFDTPLSATALDEYLLGMEALRASSFDSLRDAAERFRNVLEAEPEFHPARVQLAETLMFQLNTGASDDKALIDEAELLVKTALDAQPEDATAHRAYGVVLKWQGRWDEARAQFNRALDLAPSDSTTMSHLAKAYAGAGEIERARRLLQRAMRVDPFSVPLLHSYAFVERQFGAIDNARDALERATDMFPDNPNPHWLLGQLLITEYGELASGLQSFLHSATLDTSDYEIAAYVAAAYLTLDMPEAALPWIDRAALAGADDAVTLRAVRSLAAATQGDAQSARDHAQTAIDERDYRFRAHPLLTSQMVKAYSNAAVRLGGAGAAADFLREQRPMDDDFVGKYSSRDMDLEGLVAVSELPRRWLLENAVAYSAAGDADSAVALIDGLERARIGEVVNFRDRVRNQDFLFEAEVRALEGDTEGAFEMLESAVSNNALFGWQVYYRDNTVFDGLRDDARWTALMDRIQLKVDAERQLAANSLGMLTPADLGSGDYLDPELP